MPDRTLPTAPAPIIDIGVNLTNKCFHDDFDEVLQRARRANIEHILVTGTNLEESMRASELCAQQPEWLSGTAGFHPHHAKDFTRDHLKALKALAVQPQVKAIGECGLDFNRNFSPREAQVAALEQQLELAIELRMPLFLHERDAHQSLWEILASCRDQLTGAVVHCFTGSKEQAFRYLDLDLYLGMTGWICDERRGYHLHEFVRDIPLERLLIETDAPYLMPRVRPKPALPSERRNEPCTLPYVLQTIAANHWASEVELANTTTANARRLFNLS